MHQQAGQRNKSYKAKSDDRKSIGYLPRLGAPGYRRSLNRLLDLQPRGEPRQSLLRVRMGDCAEVKN